MAEISDLSQGDILSRVVLARHHLPNPLIAEPSEDGENLRVREEQTERHDVVAAPDSVPALVSAGLQCEAVLVSQTCDIRQERPASVAVAPVVPVSFLPENLRVPCARDRILYCLPVTEPAGAYVDLHWLTSMEKGALADAQVIGRLRTRDITRLRLKLSIMLGRPALPDEIVADLRPIQDAIAKLKESEREQVIGAYVRHDSTTVDLLVVTVTGAKPTRLAKALSQWLDKAGFSSFKRSGRIVPAVQVSLADIAGHTRLSLDYLSFPLRMEEV